VTTLTITRGLPGSGKTTWAKEQRETSARFNRDDLRFMVFGSYVLHPEDENKITQIQQSGVRAALSIGEDVVVDDTNLNPKTVKAWQKIAAEYGADFLVKDFDVNPDQCFMNVMKRRDEGGRFVPQDVILRMYNRYLKNGFPKVTPLPQPAVCAPYEGNGTRTPAYIFDVDGTMTMGPHNRSPYEWHKVGNDKPNIPVIRVMNDLWSNGAEILFVSGRDETCRPQTEVWLTEWVDDPVLFMRPAGDHRRDDVVKAEIFDREIRHQFNVLGVFDDRDQVVAFWRSIGLTCFQVAPGAF